MAASETITTEAPTAPAPVIEETPSTPRKGPDEITLRDLLEAGVHFGHQTKRWNPKMKRYIFDKRNGIHVIDLAKSMVLLKESMAFIRDVVLSGKSVLLVGTKKQAQQIIRETAEACGQPYVTTRWLGGAMTNRDTIRRSVRRLKALEAMEEKDNFSSLHKKEASKTRSELAKQRHNLSGIADMVDDPGVMFVIDVNRESIAIKEARKLNIPVVAMVDTNCDPDPIDYVIPGNDDAIRAVELIVGALGRVIEEAGAEYAKIAAELARKKEEEAKKEAEAKKAAQEVKAAARKKAEDAKGKTDKAAAPKPKAAADKKTGPAPAAGKADAKAKTDAKPKEEVAKPKADAKSKATANTKADAGPKKKNEPENKAEASADVAKATEKADAAVVPDAASGTEEPAAKQGE